VLIFAGARSLRDLVEPRKLDSAHGILPFAVLLRPGGAGTSSIPLAHLLVGPASRAETSMLFLSRIDRKKHEHDCASTHTTLSREK